jgi:hypothetical protein
MVRTLVILLSFFQRISPYSWDKRWCFILQKHALALCNYSVQCHLLMLASVAVGMPHLDELLMCWSGLFSLLLMLRVLCLLLFICFSLFLHLQTKVLAARVIATFSLACSVLIFLSSVATGYCLLVHWSCVLFYCRSWFADCCEGLRWCQGWHIGKCLPSVLFLHLFS